jgi:hypothetical protein
MTKLALGVCQKREAKLKYHLVRLGVSCHVMSQDLKDPIPTTMFDLMKKKYKQQHTF